MGYDVHITRQDNWFDQDDSKNISLEEWLDYVAKDLDIRLDNYAEATASNGETIRMEAEGLSVWTAYSGNGVGGNYAWLNYSSGNIVVKNPDEEIISKMVDMAISMNAKVQGDEGEVYQRMPNGKITSNHLDGSETKGNSKAWWKFW
jgi:hypothetical protein